MPLSRLMYHPCRRHRCRSLDRLGHDGHGPCQSALDCRRPWRRVSGAHGGK